MLKSKIFSVAGVICLVFLFVFASNILADNPIPGDANGDGSTNVSDAVRIINFIFIGGAAPVSMAAADVQYDCRINISDAVTIINHVFLGVPSELKPGCVHKESEPLCISYKGDLDSQYVVIEVLGNDIHIIHFNAYYQCCLGYFMDYSFSGNMITAHEVDTGDLCDCYCHFDALESKFYDVPTGEYELIVIGIEGDTLAVENIMVDNTQGLIYHENSGCLDIDKNPLRGAPVYNYANGILTMFHAGTEFNCAAYLIVKFEQSGKNLRFYEVNISNLWVYCICEFNVSAQVAGLAPGTYTSEVYKREPADADPELIDDQLVVIPE